MTLSGKKVLVTGAAGFIGSHLTEILVGEGAQVRAFVRYNSTNSWGWLDHIPAAALKEVEITAGDIRDPHMVSNAVRGRDMVFHLAALIGIPYSYTSPDSYVATNLQGTLNVLTASRDHTVSRVLVTSTSEVYGTALYVPIDEKHPRQGQSPYSASKIGADAMAESFFRSFQLPVTIVRPFNTYGPRQSARAIVPTVITQLLDGAGELLLGFLDPTRDMNYVTDICEGFLALALCSEADGREINVGSGTETSMGKLVGLIIELTGREVTIVGDAMRKRPDKSEVERLLCDNGLIKSLTGWQPRVSLREGLTQTLEWFMKPENLSRYKSGIYNV